MVTTVVVTDIDDEAGSCGPPAACERAAVWAGIVGLELPIALSGGSAVLAWLLKLLRPRHNLRRAQRRVWWIWCSECRGHVAVCVFEEAFYML